MRRQRHGGETGLTPSAKGDDRNGSGTRRRLAAADRQLQIVEEAVRFFAEVGFGGQTRELAQRLGITQPLLYRYFPTKKDLIERVFQEVYLKRMDPAWPKLLADRTRPLLDRLGEFYRRYAEATYRYEWIRIYMFSGLMGKPLNRRYIHVIESKILRRICVEIRVHCGLPEVSPLAISELELEHVWVMHGGLFYYAVRKHIYQSRVSRDFTAIVARTVAAMLEGVKAVSSPGAPR